MPPANTPRITSPVSPQSSIYPASLRRTVPPTPPSPPSVTSSANLADLQYLSSPVPDYAATLHIEEAEEANVTFLRDSLESLDRTQTHIDPHRDPRQQAAPSQHTAELQTQESAQTFADNADDLSRRERLQRVLARLNRMHDPAAGSSAAAYSNRTPSPSQQRLYDWAPSHEETAQQEDSELENILADLRREQPATHPDNLRVLRQSQFESTSRREQQAEAVPSVRHPTNGTEQREQTRERRRRESEWVSLRSRAVLQRARQESGSPSTTERMQRYVFERERSGMSEEEERARGTGWFRPGTNRVGDGISTSAEQQRSGGFNREPWPVPPSASEMSSRSMQERTDAMQRRYLTQDVPPRLPRISTPPVPMAASPRSSPSQILERALAYLDQLRSCCRYEESLSAAMDHGLATKEFLADKHDDFIMDIAELKQIAGSSWLQPCTIFEGHQHATNGNAGLLQPRPARSLAHSVEQINPNFRDRGGSTTGFDHPPGSTQVQPFDATRPWLSHQFTPPFHNTSSLSVKPLDPAHDRWPVRVIIHSIDTEKMTLQGTMEAYDVPQHPASLSLLAPMERPKAGKKHAPITTYLEGHIIDLALHSFLSPNTNENKLTGPHATSLGNTTPYTTISDTITFPAASAHTDASNWRKLPPFNQLHSDEDMARCLLSRIRMNRIQEEYIFMRWKERCFVHSKDDARSEVDRASDQDRGHGLTISGFYYVSLRRSDGAVEGLYFDPTSTPYQHLRLRGQRTGWPAFGFR